MKKLRIAAVNSEANVLQIEQNMTHIKEHLTLLSAEGVEYALFPELSVSGYLNSFDLLEQYAHLHEQTLAHLLVLSKEIDMIFSVGLPLPVGKEWGIGQVTLLRGEILHTYLKTHLSVNEKKHYVSGNQLSNIRAGAWNMGLQLCLESHYPELSLKQQEQGAELLCFAMASPRESALEKYERLLPVFKTRAYDNACFVMSCNLGGISASGIQRPKVAMIISPRGQVIAQAVDEDYCVATIDSDQLLAIKESKMGNFPAYRQMNMYSSFKTKQKNTKDSEELMRPVMFVGTGSDVGKSVVAAAYCRILLQDGFHPAPFKSQNMSLNSYVSRDGGELGRAQAVQAEACNIPCHTDMNPILLKPCSDRSSQIVLNGKPVGTYSARSYFAGEQKMELFKEAINAYQRLAKQYAPIVIEGAGSISELNLKKRDIVNMRVALETNAATFLIADIDRGGVFASLYGSVMLLDDEERQQIKGFIINKFRGDVSLFDEGRKILEDLTGIPVLAVIPTFRDIYIEDEDSVSVEMKKKTAISGKVNIAVVLLRQMSNFTDFSRLEQDDRVNLFYSNNVEEVQKADIIILPGTKNTMSDLKEIKSNGIAQVVHQAARDGKSVIGICGGYQMMGMRIEDPEGVEGDELAMGGLSILPTTTIMENEKQTTQHTFRYKSHDQCKGYEIHMGKTAIEQGTAPLNTFADGITEGCMVNEQCWGSYMHGILDNEAVIDDLLAPFDVAEKETLDYDSFKQEQYDKLADHVRAVTDMDLFYKLTGYKKKGGQND